MSRFLSVASGLLIVCIGGVAGAFSDNRAPAAVHRSTLSASSRHAQQPEYSGSRDGCRKCHLREYRSWERTPHAKAMDVLSANEQQDPNCVGCHTTGFGKPGGFVSLAETPKFASVGCESCHGPGSIYRDKDVMENHDASVAAGLLIPDEATCVSCHNSDSPTFLGDFDFEARKEQGVHSIR